MNLNQLRNANRPAFVASVLLCLLLCACITYWLTVLLAPAPPIAPAEVVADPRSNVDVRPAGALFGLNSSAANAPAATVSDIQVLGLASTRLRPVAILVLDGKPARAFGEGDQVANGIKLLEVAPDRVIIERDGRRVDLAAPQASSVAVLTSGVGKNRDPALRPPVTATPVFNPSPGGGQPPPGVAPPGMPPAMPTMPPAATPPAAAAPAVMPQPTPQVDTQSSAQQQMMQNQPPPMPAQPGTPPNNLPGMMPPQAPQSGPSQ